jgi:hypothetical protein
MKGNRLSRRNPGGVVGTSIVAAVRSAGDSVGRLAIVVFPAIAIGGVAGRLAPRDAAVVVALSITALTALLGGLAARPLLGRRLRPYTDRETDPTPGAITHGGGGDERVPARR